MTDTLTTIVWIGAILVPVCGLAVVLAAVLFFLIRRNAGQAKALGADWATLAQKHGFDFDPGDLMRSPTVSGVIDGQAIRLTYGSYRMGSGGMQYRYTQAVAGLTTAGEVLIADRRRQHHAAGVNGPELPISAPPLAATHIALGQPSALGERFLVPALLARYQAQAISHVRLGGGQLLVQRPGHLSAEADSLALMQLAAVLAGLAATPPPTERQ